MADIKTKDGFECSIADDVLNDWELLEDFRAVDRGDVGAIIDVAPKFLGKEQYDALKEFVRVAHGKVQADVMVEILGEIMNLAGEIKKS